MKRRVMKKRASREARNLRKARVALLGYHRFPELVNWTVTNMRAIERVLASTASTLRLAAAL
jgi:hypothetical protein